MRIILGDSGIELKRLLPQLRGPTVFWLDAHYSGGSTAGDGYVPILEEIDAVSTACQYPHAILIDDMKDFIGADGYPTQEQLQLRLDKLGYVTDMFNNMLHATRR